MKKIIYCMLILMSAFVSAKDGLIIQLTITEESLDGSAKDRYINGVLMDYPGTTKTEFPGLYEVKFLVENPETDLFEIVFTLKDLSSGKPYYVGAAPIELKAGDSGTLNFERDGRKYTVEMDSSYGKLP